MVQKIQMKFISIIVIFHCFSFFGKASNAKYDTLINSDFLKKSSLIKYSSIDSLLVDSIGIGLVYNNNYQQGRDWILPMYENNKKELCLYNGLIRVMDFQKRLIEIKLVVKGYILAKIKYDTNYMHSDTLQIKQISFYNYPVVRKILLSNLEEQKALIQEFNIISTNSFSKRHSELYNHFLKVNYNVKEKQIYTQFNFEQNNLVLSMTANVDMGYYQTKEKLENDILSYGKVSNFQIENYKTFSGSSIFSIQEKNIHKVNAKLRSAGFQIKKLNIKKSNYKDFIFTNNGVLKKNNEGKYEYLSFSNDDLTKYKSIIKSSYHLTPAREDTIKIITKLDEGYFNTLNELKKLDFRNYFFWTFYDLSQSNQSTSGTSYFWQISVLGQLNGKCGSLNSFQQINWIGQYLKNMPYEEWSVYDLENSVKKGIRKYKLNEKFSEKGICKILDERPDFLMKTQNMINPTSNLNSDFDLASDILWVCNLWDFLKP
jgi:hypothetical protein